MHIPFVDLTLSSSTTKSVLKKFAPLIQQGDFILGKQVESFEKAFAKYISAKYCVGVGSGTDALFLSLKALGVGNGDEVIVPAMTFIATANAVLYTGATPIFVDIYPERPTIDVSKIEEKITKKTKAMIPVHMQGMPARMDEIMKIAKKHRLYVLEDACQAHGSLFKDKKMGSFGTTAAFSFYPSKNLGAFGDAGAVMTSDNHIAARLLRARHHGQQEKDVHADFGYNSRLDALQAVVLQQKLVQLDANNALRRKHAALYTSLLENLPLVLPQEEDGVLGNYHLYTVRLKQRNKLQQYLKQKSIATGIHYPSAMHLHPALQFLGYKKGDFPNAEKYAEENLSLPMYAGLTDRQIKYVVEQTRKFFRKSSR